MGFFKKLFGKNTDDFYAPMAGKAVPITEVPDPTFAEGMLGNGIAIEPAEGKVYAPFSLENVTIICFASFLTISQVLL